VILKAAKRYRVPAIELPSLFFVFKMNFVFYGGSNLLDLESHLLQPNPVYEKPEEK
jgi:hypothetical protein